MNRLKELRLQTGCTQAEFGKIFNASQNTVSNWESGNRKIDNARLIEFASYFGVSIDYLLGQTNERNNSKEKAPTVSDDGLDDELVKLLVDLSPSEVQRVLDFVAGLKAARAEDASHQG